MPRIISGRARGTRLAAPRGSLVRPTGDKVKEALFSILAPHMPAQGFIDLFAGTGQIGLEAASRGAAPVCLVENAAASLAVIRANLQKTHLEAQVEVLACDAAEGLARLLGRGRPYDLIFLDPPYAAAHRELARLAPLLGQLLGEEGLVIIEHLASDPPVAFVTNLQLRRSCQYGSAMISFYKVDQSASSNMRLIPPDHA
jgi:16S rRNA (guanine(966)-N(2))-methyltransferase RsmD